MIVFIFTLITHVYWFGRGLLSTIPINQFDGVLRIIADNAVRNNFSLYKDVMIVYPPGYALLFGKVLEFISSEYRQTIASMLIFLLVILSTYCLKKSLQTSFFDSRISLFLLISSLWYQQIPGDAFSLPLVIILIILMNRGLKQFQSYTWYLIMLFTGLLTFFRWDFPLLLIIILGGLSLYEWFAYKSMRMMRVTIPLVVGFFIGVLGVVMYVFTPEGIVRGIEGMITIPTQVILPYRSLPLPIPWHAPKILNTLLYAGIFIWICSALVISKIKKLRIDHVFFMFIPLLLLPYATGRADWPHAIPLFSVIVLVFIFASIHMRSWMKYGITCLILIFLTKLLLPNTAEHVSAFQVVQKNIRECASLVQTFPAKTIFIGRNQYTQFSYNTAALYLTRKDLRPATAYVSDEPGLQNSCVYGSRIVEQLKTASKPMVSFIEVGVQPKEPNASANMKSCNKIEEYLRVAPHKNIGECSSYGQQFEARVY